MIYRVFDLVGIIPFRCESLYLFYSKAAEAGRMVVHRMLDLNLSLD